MLPCLVQGTGPDVALARAAEGVLGDFTMTNEIGENLARLQIEAARQQYAEPVRHLVSGAKWIVLPSLGSILSVVVASACLALDTTVAVAAIVVCGCVASAIGLPIVKGMLGKVPPSS